MKKCAIVIPYFGTSWPVWFPLYLYSLEKNKTILNVLFITNLLPPKKAPDNSIFYIFSFEEYCEYVSDKLHIKFRPDNPYKLCDLKPFLPIIHADKLAQYDYVGFGDIDLVYGNLSKWLNKIRNNTTMISTHLDRISGHFVLFKNSPNIIKKAFRIYKWKEILQSNRHYGIDEGRFSYVHFPFLYSLSCFFQYRLKLKKLGKNICNASIWINPNLHLKEMFTTPLPQLNSKWVYSNGEIMDPNGNEIPYLHFLFFKKTKYNPSNQRYWKDGFYKIKQPIEIDGKSVCIDIDGIRLEDVK